MVQILRLRGHSRPLTTLAVLLMRELYLRRGPLMHICLEVLHLRDWGYLWGLTSLLEIRHLR